MNTYILSVLFSFSIITIFSQEFKKNHDFLANVQFGGNIDVYFSNNSTTLGISPATVYNINDKLGFGLTASYTYLKNNNNTFNIYSGGILTLYKPFNSLQLSSEFEQSFINIENTSSSVPALYFGIATIVSKNIYSGFKYDVLYNKQNSIYSFPITPFVSIFF